MTWRPLGLALSRQRTMVDCNQALCEMFAASREQLVGHSFRILYPSTDEYERTGARIVPILGAVAPTRTSASCRGWTAASRVRPSGAT